MIDVAVIGYGRAGEAQARCYDAMPQARIVAIVDPTPARRDAARARFPQAEVVAVAGAKHLWVGDAERVLDEIVLAMNPATAVPLPTEWDGPMETADTSAYADRTTAVFKDKPS